MRESADGDAVHAGGRDGRNAFQRDAAAGFEHGATLNQPNSLDHFVIAHVVEQDDVRAGIGRGRNLIESVRLDLDFKLADDPKIALQRYGQYLYDGLILFCPTTERKLVFFLLLISFVS